VSASLGALFAQFSAQAVQLDRIEVSADGEKLSLFVTAGSFDPQLPAKLKAELASRFPKRKAAVFCSFPAESFCGEALSLIVQEMRLGGFLVNGFFGGASMTVEGDNAAIALPSKTAVTLRDMQFEEKFCRCVQRMFGRTVSVTLTEPESAQTVPVGDKPSGTMTAPAAAKGGAAQKKRRTDKLNDADMGNKLLPLENDEFEIIIGKKPALSSIISIKDAVVDAGRCTISGDIVESESKELRNGATVRTLLLTDYTDSVTIKVYDDEGRFAPLSELKNGSTVVCAGEVYYDEREHGFVFRPRDVIKVNRRQQHDNAPEKRIELHLHTNMSQMDALPSAEAAIMRAASLGHPGIAITDHGSVQAFPDARSALKKARAIVPDFKVIYGCEAYYVDDSAKIVLGTLDAEIGAEVVCFDLETTGLDCENERIIEIGACVVREGQICETFGVFVDPERAIPERITELTGITDAMVAGAPKEREALDRFFAFCAGRPLVAHNAAFDMSFLKAACVREGRDEALNMVCIDTLALAQTLLPELSRHRLDSLTRHFKLPSFDHHRGSDDAVALARIYLKLLELLEAQGIANMLDVNERLGGRNVKHAKSFHMILLVKDLVGLKNLYTLVSKGNVEYFHSRPRVPLSELLRHREGLIIGSACESGEIYRAILEHRPKDELLRIAQKYDYFEIQPRGNNAFLIREGAVADEKAILDINRQIVALAEELEKPCVATCDVHFLDPKDAFYREILMHGQGFSDAEHQPMLIYRTTEEMLQEFSYLGEAKAKEVVIDAPLAIAAQIDPDIKPIPDGDFTPTIPGSEEQITESSYKKIKELYGDNPDEFITARAKRELDSICGNGYAVLYLIAQKLVDKSESDGYHVGSRGSVGSSYVAFLLGISEVNPLPAHYLCPNCKHFEFTPDTADGFDLPAKNCPHCGTPLNGDGHNIPFETFLGFHGEKVPDIDLNFSSEYQNNIFKYTEELFGSDYVFKAGTIMALQDKNAMGYVRKYSEEKGIIFSRAEMRRLALGCTGVKKSTGQHPGGMVVIPSNHDINDFTPVQRPADKAESDFVTTHFDFNSLHDTLLKLDELGHEIPTTFHYLEDFSGMSIRDVPNSDPEVFRLFTSPEPLGVTAQQIGSETGTFGIPEMGTVTSRKLLFEAKPKGIADLIQVSGLSHGTGVWAGNAQDLIQSGTCNISEVIGTRDGIMITLIEYGVDKDMAFKIMEFVRKNKNSKPLPEEMVKEMRDHGVPEWYIDSCRKIQYMFPKAHAAAYVTSAVKVAWFKLYRPLDFYAAYFTVRGCDTDVEYLLGSVDKVRRRISEVEKVLQDFNSRTAKDEDEMVSLQMLLEMKCRGYEFLPVDLRHSHFKRFNIEDGKLRVPFTVLKGVGENAAKSLVEAVGAGEFSTAEDLVAYPGVSQSLIDLLEGVGALGDLPKTRQISFF